MSKEGTAYLLMWESKTTKLTRLLNYFGYQRSPSNLVEAGLIKIQSDDVFLVSFPRSGNTWIRYMLANLIFPECDWTVENIHQVVPDIYETSFESSFDVYPRIIKSHERATKQYKKVIYIYRDGRDVSVSYYDYMVKLWNYPKDFTTFLKEMLAGQLRFGAWQDHVAGWIWGVEGVEILEVCYEQLFGQISCELKRVGGFLGYEWTEKDIEMANNRSTVDRIRKDIHSLKYSSQWSKGYRGGVKGGPGAWKEKFTSEHEDIFWKKAGTIARKLGYER